MATIFEELATRLRRTDLLLLRAVRRQRARPAMRAKGQFWGSVITDDEVDALLRSHGEIDYPTGVDGLEEAVGASAALRDDPDGRFGRLRRALDLDGDDSDLITHSSPPVTTFSEQPFRNREIIQRIPKPHRPLTLS